MSVEAQRAHLAGKGGYVKVFFTFHCKSAGHSTSKGITSVGDRRATDNPSSAWSKWSRSEMRLESSPS
eukprot:9397476-Pyramimonas_sp.AAC.1